MDKHKGVLVLRTSKQLMVGESVREEGEFGGTVAYDVIAYATKADWLAQMTQAEIQHAGRIADFDESHFYKVIMD